MAKNNSKKGSNETEESLLSIGQTVDHLLKWIESDINFEEGGEKRIKEIKIIFSDVHRYLQHLYEKEKEQLKNQNTQKGIQAIMDLIEEAANAIQKNVHHFNDEDQSRKILNLKEYKNLKTYYEGKILKSFKTVSFLKVESEKSRVAIDEKMGLEKEGIRDLEMVKRDEKYELFYLVQEDGTPFFDRNILRHIKLVNDFDQMIRDFSEQDPLLKICLLFDQEVEEVAKEIYQSVAEALKNFYANAFPHKELPLVNSMLKITMSLMLACSSNNRVEKATGKVCSHYFQDFHKFLREFFASIEYKEVIHSSTQEINPLAHSLVHLAHLLAFAFFNHHGNKKKFLVYFNHLMCQSSYTNSLVGKGDCATTDDLIDTLFEIYENVSKFVEKFPNGPLFKSFDVFQNWSREEGFDPINQGNFPHYLYSVSSKNLKTSCLKIPCPTSQIYINKAEVIDEFKGFLRHFEDQKGVNCHLHFNLQDQTSWAQHARCDALERLQKEAEFSKQFVLVCLPKNDAFYFQSENYLKMDGAKDFLRLLKEQIKGGKAHGYFFSKQIDRQPLLDFTKKIIDIIHFYFFKENLKLSLRERVSFIEIFYLFLELKVIDMIEPLTFTFSCKDGIDIGATSSAAFFIFLKLLGSNEKWELEALDHLVWILYGPSLMIRQRLVHEKTFRHIAFALKTLTLGFQKERHQILEKLKPLFSASFFEKIRVSGSF